MRFGLVTTPRLGISYMQLATVRLRPLKIGARVVELPGRIHPHLTSGHPSEPLWRAPAAHQEGSRIIWASGAQQAGIVEIGEGQAKLASFSA